MSKFTIGVLLYGDYPKLAQRCLTSIANTIRAEDLNLRVGLNAVSPQVTAWVKSWVPESCILEFPENINKYPLMRQMIHGVNPVDTEYFMWFDDDSWLTGYELGTVNNKPYWLQLVDHAMASADMIGSIYTMKFRGKQRDWVRAQSWYGGNDPKDRRLRFATGGWWTIRTQLLYDFNYPWPELDHNGGDSLLGEMLLQQKLRIQQFNEGVKINAADNGKESGAKRRGTSQPPLGHDYDPGVGAALNRATTPASITRPKIIEL